MPHRVKQSMFELAERNVAGDRNAKDLTDSTTELCIHGMKWWFVLGVILALRLVSMIWLPLLDTSEPRYAEIARIMAATGDWITPWFSPGVPFWGKPPLAFWSEAVAFRALGVSEFAARLPSWLATLATLFFIYKYSRKFFDAHTAQWAVLIYSTFALTYIASGAVLTDPFFTAAIAGACVCFAMAIGEDLWAWRYGFFVCIAMGILAKGPLMLVLVGGALLPVLLLNPSLRAQAKKLPWFSGLALTLLIAAPWYLLAELKTPGFLRYFIIGEHFLRFVDPGWSGDLYGNAHRRIKGTIWLYALAASIPWSPLFAVELWRRFKRSDRALTLRSTFGDSRVLYLAAWTLFPLVFFTVASNILWTYTQPALPSLAILISLTLSKGLLLRTRRPTTEAAMLGFVPLCIGIATAVLAVQPQQAKSEKELVSFVTKQHGSATQLAYFGKVPFSAQFYSQGSAREILPSELNLAEKSYPDVYLAVPLKQFESLSTRMATPLPVLFKNRRYVLTLLPTTTASDASAATAHSARSSSLHNES